MKVYLIDANALIYRIYHAMPRLEDPQGRPIQAVYGLANILLKLLQQEKIDYVFALYDRPEPTLRHQVFKEYKATRPIITDDLKIQISLSKKIFEAFQIPIIEKIGYEADDLIATLKESLLLKVDEIIILTGDLDTLQLVDQKTKILTMKKGITEMNIYDIQKVKEKFGILPEQIPDYKALVGDPSDNIPGIPDIGPKTAAKLLKAFLNLEGIIKAAKERKLDPNLISKILKEKEKILFYRELVTLRKNIDLDDKVLTPYQGFSKENLIKLFQEFNFRSLINRLKKQEEFISETKNLISEEKRELFFIEKTDLNKIKLPFFFYIEKDHIKILDETKEIKIVPLKELKNLLLLDQEKFTFDLKNILKIIFKEDFYFDKKFDLSKVYDLKILFWLLNPSKINYSLENIVFYLEPRTNNFLVSVFGISQKLLEKLKELELEKIYFHFELPLVPILARTELRGIKVDPEALKKFKEELIKKTNEILKEIFNLTREKFNPNSPIQLRKILFEKLKIKTKGLVKTKKGEISTQESELLKLVGEHPIIEKILEYRKMNKILTTYTDSLLKTYDPKTGRIYTVFNQTGTSTGRIASESPNLQNLPLVGDLAKTLRSIFVTDENFVFVSGDYSQIELRILTHLSKDESLISAFLQDLDLHSQTAKMIFGDDSEENRRKAKIINFGIIYGISAKGLAERLLIPVSQTSKIIEKFYYFYPGVKKLKEDLINFAKTYGYVETLFGRKRFIPEIHSQSYAERTFAERVAMNMPIQGFGADLLKKAMIDIDKEIFQKSWQDAVFFVLSIHDEIIFEVKKEIKDEFKDIIKEKMEKVYELIIPLKIKIKEGENLKDLE